MVYSNKFVICVLVHGQPQKELSNGTVSLPFGTEYALRLRNKNNRRAVAKIYIDGENVSGGGYVVGAHDYVDIKRHHDIDRAFKFVSLDSPDAVDHGKNGPNPDKVKGTIEVRFYLEKERPQVIYRDVHHDHHHHHHYPAPLPPPRPYDPWRKNPDITWVTNTCDMKYEPDGGSVKYTCDAGGGAKGMTSNLGGGGTMSSCSLGGAEASRSYEAPQSYGAVQPQSFNFSSSEKLQDGCTVEGYSTGQSFHNVWVDTEDEATVLKIFLQGFESLQEVAAVPQRPTNKGQRIDDLEAENEELRRKIAEMENQKLKEQLSDLEK